MTKKEEQLVKRLSKGGYFEGKTTKPGYWAAWIRRRFPNAVMQVEWYEDYALIFINIREVSCNR